MTCVACGEVLTGEMHKSYLEYLYCPKCLEDVPCDCCGKKVWKIVAARDDNITLCFDCYRRSYLSCEECGRIILKKTLSILMTATIRIAGNVMSVSEKVP